MNIHSQNLNESRGVTIGSMFWRGRAWLRNRDYRELFHVEWLLGKYARDFSLKATFGYGDSDSGLLLHLCIPFLFSVYLVFPHVYRCTESSVGVAIHNQAVWLYTFTTANESRSDWPWWRKNHAWHFPWEWRWLSTEILDGRTGTVDKWPSVWKSFRGGPGFMDNYDERQRIEKDFSITNSYRYVLKSGEVQNRTVTVHAERMTHTRRWPIIPGRLVRTSIDVEFDKETGEGTGSWKGGVVATGYDVRADETMIGCLRRMEKELKFNL